MTSGVPRVLARFGTESGRLTDSVVKPKLFEPTRDLKLSVFRVEGLGRKSVIALGKTVVKSHPQAQRLYGWGEISESGILNARLHIDYDDVPLRHATIIGWPQDPAQRKHAQQLLASCATPKRLRSPIEVH